MNLIFLRRTSRVGVQRFRSQLSCLRQFSAMMGSSPKVSLEWMVLTLQANDTPQNAISSNPLPVEPKTLQEVFNDLDRDRDGSITTSDLVTGFKKFCRIEVSEEVVDQIMMKTDLDENGTIEFNELEYLMKSYQGQKNGKI